MAVPRGVEPPTFGLGNRPQILNILIMLCFFRLYENQYVIFWVIF
jgi:hypothetical protein